MATDPTANEQERLQQWGGYMFKRDKTATPKLDALLRGIAECISQQFERGDHSDLTPPALAAFYRAVGGSYDQLFLQTHPQSIAFIYKNLGCPHSLQPSSPAPTIYSDPIVPALKPHGFTVWQSIQLLLGPAEHVPFIQEALRIFDVRDPDTGEALPKYIPSAAFPLYPDPDMVSWHATVSERLRVEAQRALGNGRPASPTSSSDESTDATTATNERTDAAHFFANPLYKNRDGRPDIVRQLTKAPARVLQGGKTVAQNVFNGGKMILSPGTFGGPVRKKSRSRSPSAGRDGHHRSHGHASGEHRHVTESGGRASASGTRSSSGGYRKPQRPSRKVMSPTTSEEDREDDLEHDRRRRASRRTRSHEGQSTSNDMHDADSKSRRHNSVHYSTPASRGSQYENGPTLNVQRPSDVENQTPHQNQNQNYDQNQNRRSSFPQQPKATNVTNTGQDSASSARQQPTYQGPNASQFRKEYSSSLRQHQQSQAQATNPQQAAQQFSRQRPAMAVRTSSADRRGYEGRRVSFADPSRREEGYASSGLRPEEGLRSAMASGSNGSRPTEAQPMETRASTLRTQVSPSAQQEWDGLRQTLSGKSSEGEGKGENKGASQLDEAKLEGKDATGMGEGFGEGAIGMGRGVMNGVRGRRFVNEAPWMKEE